VIGRHGRSGVWSDGAVTVSGGPQRVHGAHGVPLTVCVPAGEARGGIVVVQEIYGVTEHLVAVTEALAAQGYLAVAPHLYHRVAYAPVRTYREARPLARGLTGQDIRHDLDDALGALGSAGIGLERTGILGYSMGGTVALWAAATMPIAAAVSFYGAGLGRSRWPGVPAGLESAAALRAPWLGLFGDRDSSIPVDQVEALQAILASAASREATASARAEASRESAASRGEAPPTAGSRASVSPPSTVLPASPTSPVPAAVVRYPHAGHGFASGPGSRHYRPGDAADAWARAAAWFDTHLG
jgi:carboxymethylenebutenolidase